jgi:hypothetical protein
LLSKPSEALENLHQTVVNVFPDLKTKYEEQEGGFQHHISMGNFGDEMTAQKVIEMIKENWKPIEFEVNEVYFCTKDINLVYQNRICVSLGEKEIKPAFQCIPEK